MFKYLLLAVCLAQLAFANDDGEVIESQLQMSIKPIPSDADSDRDALGASLATGGLQMTTQCCSPDVRSEFYLPILFSILISSTLSVHFRNRHYRRHWFL